jgi:predicted nucleotidyltransferase component of viral defense system
VVTVDPSDLADALSEGFPQATAEKVHRLLGILREIQAIRSTRGQFTLKGGTALNVFHLPQVPRLSVDLDLMATGFPGATAGSPEHDRVVQLVREVLEVLGYRVTVTESPAACSLTGHYRNSLGGADQVKIDLDLLNRQTLLAPRRLSGPRIFLADDVSFPVVREAELLGQKLVAVDYRAHARDLFDMHLMVGSGWHRKPRARAMYLAYSFLQDSAWFRLDYPVRMKVAYRPSLLEDVLREDEPAPRLRTIRARARRALSSGPAPFTRVSTTEQSLRRDLLDGHLSAFAEIAGERVAARRRKLARHPGLRWRLQQAKGQTPRRPRGP